MRKPIRWKLVLAAVVGAWIALWLCGGDRNPEAAAAVSMSVLPQFSAHSPATILLTVRTPRDAHNRSLVIGIAGEPYYRTSYEQMDGEDAAAVRSMFFYRIPAGHYTAFAVLLRNDGTTSKANAYLCVVGPNESC